MYDSQRWRLNLILIFNYGEILIFQSDNKEFFLLDDHTRMCCVSDMPLNKWRFTLQYVNSRFQLSIYLSV